MKRRKLIGILLTVFGLIGSLSLSGLRIYESYYKWITNDSGKADTFYSFADYFLTFYIYDIAVFSFIGLFLTAIGVWLYCKKK